MLRVVGNRRWRELKLVALGGGGTQLGAAASAAGSAGQGSEESPSPGAVASSASPPDVVPPPPAAERAAQQEVDDQSDQTRLFLLLLFSVWLALFYCCLERSDVAVHTDKAEAEKLFHQSAAAGHWQSLFSLGLIAQEKGDVAGASFHFAETVEAVARLRYDKNQALRADATVDAKSEKELDALINKLEADPEAKKKYSEQELVELAAKKTEHVRRKQALVFKASREANWTRLV